ncbi:hypothetical protein A5775_07605 [Mycobacterium sp. 852002-10029_SCH5224772]|nr:hypothetical protein A5775_07605 [Mycobacterium sp. 852002-10029_SCH5224772]
MFTDGYEVVNQSGVGADEILRFRFHIHDFGWLWRGSQLRVDDDLLHVAIDTVSDMAVSDLINLPMRGKQFGCESLCPILSESQPRAPLLMGTLRFCVESPVRDDACSPECLPDLASGVTSWER